jgi:hypothetical protein
VLQHTCSLTIKTREYINIHNKLQRIVKHRRANMDEYSFDLSFLFGLYPVRQTFYAFLSNRDLFILRYVVKDISMKWPLTYSSEKWRRSSPALIKWAIKHDLVNKRLDPPSTPEREIDIVGILLSHNAITAEDAEKTRVWAPDGIRMKWPTSHNPTADEIRQQPLVLECLDHGEIFAAMWFIERGFATDEAAHYAAGRSRSDRVVLALKQRLGRLPIEVLYGAAETDDVEFVVWVSTHIAQPGLNVKTRKRAPKKHITPQPVKTKSVRVMGWFLDNRLTTAYDSMGIAVTEGNLDVAIFLAHAFTEGNLAPVLKQAHMQAAEARHHHITRWLIDNELMPCPITRELLAEFVLTATRKSLLHIAQYAGDLFASMPELYEHPITNNNYKIVYTLHELGCPITPQVMDFVSGGATSEMEKWLKLSSWSRVACNLTAPKKVEADKYDLTPEQLSVISAIDEL